MSKAGRDSKRTAKRAGGPATELRRNGEAYAAPRREAYLVQKLALDGPLGGILVQGEGRPGAVADLLVHLSDAKIRLISVQAMTDERGGFSSFIYVLTGDVDRTISCLSAL